jgi:hypothetical protein
MRAVNSQEDIKISDESDDLKWFDEVPTFASDVSIDVPRMFEKWSMRAS